MNFAQSEVADRNLFAVEHEIGEKGIPNSPAAKVKINMAGRLTARFSVQPRTSFFSEMNRVFLKFILMLCSLTSSSQLSPELYGLAPTYGHRIRRSLTKLHSSKFEGSGFLSPSESVCSYT